METTFESYFQFLGKLGETLDRLTELAKRKTASVYRDDLLGVDECVKQEQALSMALRGMDTKREKMLADLGLAGVPLSELAQNCPVECRSEARRASDALRAKYDLYRRSADMARTALECTLYEIEKYLDEANNGTPAKSVADIRA